MAANIQPIPEWATDTPHEVNYTLIMFDSGGEGAQDIAMTREEFIALKKQLAAMRCYSVPVLGSKVVELAREMETAPWSMAKHLIFARELYRQVPEAIASEEGIETALEALNAIEIKTADEAIRAVLGCGRLEGYNIRDEQQIAAHLMTARDLYNCLPDLVTLPSPEMDSESPKWRIAKNQFAAERIGNRHVET